MVDDRCRMVASDARTSGRQLGRANRNPCRRSAGPCARGPSSAGSHTNTGTTGPSWSAATSAELSASRRLRRIHHSVTPGTYAARGVVERALALATRHALVLTRSPMRRLVQWLVFPVVMGGAIGAAIALMPAFGIVGAVTAVQATGAVTIVLLERLLPFRPRWNRSHGDLRTDALHAVVAGVGTAQVLLPFVKLAGGLLAARVAGLVGASLWPTGWPLPAQLALAVVIGEFFQYWLHRWQHEREFLWRFHAVHHSAPRLYWLNAARFHPLDLGVLYLVGYLPLVGLGCPEEVILLFALFDGVFGMLQHCNVDVRLGPLNWVFSMAEPHRWHHSRTVAEANSNYGSNLILWDHVFGSFALPRDRDAPETIGIGDMPRFPPGYLAQLATPFRWRAAKRAAAG